jgi:hypothetical protein
VQEIRGSSCTVFKSAPSSTAGSDLSSYVVVAWTMHPDLIPTEVGCVVLELEGTSEVGQRPLFLCASEIIHSRQDNLQFQVFIELLEVHDFSLPSHHGDDDDGLSTDPNDSPFT